jgi:hypothetical protein
MWSTFFSAEKKQCNNLDKIWVGLHFGPQKTHLVTLAARMVEGQLGYFLELKKQDMELSIRALQLI